MVTQGELLWSPDAVRRDGSRMAEFARFAGQRHGLELTEYDALRGWSVEDLAG